MRGLRRAALLVASLSLLVALVGSAQPAGEAQLADRHAGAAVGARHAAAVDARADGHEDDSLILGISANDEAGVLAEVEAEALLAEREEYEDEGEASEADAVAHAFEEELTLREEQLFGPLAERDADAALRGLRTLAEAVPLEQADAPVTPATHASVSPHVATGSDALFVLAALAFAGVLPPAQVPWDDGWATAALRRAAAAGCSEASLALGDRLVHDSDAPDCEAGLPFMRAAADEVLSRAEAAADHSVPREPVRLRDRLRDGAWAARADENAPQQLRMEEDLAARGVPEALRHLGYRRLLGRGVPEDVAGAAAAFAAAAAAGDEYAAFNMGYIRMRGSDGIKNFTAAAELFNAAAAKDLPAAFNGLGVLAFNGWGQPRNYTAARLAFEEGAARGDPDSSYNLGMLRAGGYGVPADAAAALACFEAASEAGHWRAPHTLAGMHAEGNGTPRNCTRAARLVALFVEERLSWAAEVDDALAAYDGGDAAGALAHLALLAAQGCEAAAANIAFLLRAGAATWLSREQALERAAALLRFAAARGGVEAHVDLGDMAAARGDQAAAQRHYSDAAEADVAEGMFALGVMHMRGRADGGARNLSAARQLFEQAWEAAPTEEAVIPPALALAWLRVLELAALCSADALVTLESGLLAALTLALALVLHRHLQLRAPIAVDAPPAWHAAAEAHEEARAARGEATNDD